MVLAAQEVPSSLSSVDMLRDLGAYLTLEKAERSFGFDPAAVGLTGGWAGGRGRRAGGWARSHLRALCRECVLGWVIRRAGSQAHRSS